MKKGDWIPLPKTMYIECCDCGLQHEINIRILSRGIHPLQWRATPLKGKNRVDIKNLKILLDK